MNAEGGKIWKKLSKTDLKISERMAADLPQLDTAQRELFDDLTDKLDDTFEVNDIRTIISPHNFKRIIVARITRTEK